MPGEAVKLKLPAGLFQNSTEYSGAGRYIDGDLIRWHNSAIKPINGWRKRHDFLTGEALSPLWGDGTATEAVRSGTVTGDDVAGLNMWLGSNKKIYFVSNTNVITDVTPVGFVAQGKDAAFSIGYGLFRYSFGQYGTPRPQQQGRMKNVFSWGFTNWGFWPVAVAREIQGLPVYIKRATDATFVAVTGSPEGAHDVLVTDERFMMTFGQTTNFRRIAWSDQENFEEWVPSVSNQAGDITLAGVGKLIRAVKVNNLILVIGDNDAFSGQYLGPPYVYGFNRVGTRCGICGPEAVAVTDTFAMWLSGLAFYRFDGTVREVPCEVMDHYLETRSFTQRSKTMAFTISDYSEIWWFYQSNTSETGEPDKYIIYNYALDRWYTGTLDRTFGLDADPLTFAMMVSPEGQLYDHEIVSAGRDGRVPFVETGPLELNNGERLLGVSYVIPDAYTSNDVLMELSVRDYPQNEPMLLRSAIPPRYSRVFTLQNPTSTMGIMGRDIRMRLYASLDTPNWTIGDFRVIPNSGGGPMR